MFEALPLRVFTTPAVLLALATLPALWLLLRVTPPQPRRIDFPPLKLILDLVPRQETPARTPWWLLLLRLIVAGLVIVAMAGPVWNPAKDTARGSGPDPADRRQWLGRRARLGRARRRRRGSACAAPPAPDVPSPSLATGRDRRRTCRWRDAGAAPGAAARPEARAAHAGPLAMLAAAAALPRARDRPPRSSGSATGSPSTRPPTSSARWQSAIGDKPITVLNAGMPRARWRSPACRQLGRGPDRPRAARRSRRPRRRHASAPSTAAACRWLRRRSPSPPARTRDDGR